MRIIMNKPMNNSSEIACVYYHRLLAIVSVGSLAAPTTAAVLSHVVTMLLSGVL